MAPSKTDVEDPTNRLLIAYNTLLDQHTTLNNQSEIFIFVSVGAHAVGVNVDENNTLLQRFDNKQEAG